jgi:hypothetical protein
VKIVTKTGQKASRKDRSCHYDEICLSAMVKKKTFFAEKMDKFVQGGELLPIMRGQWRKSPI